MLRWQCSCHDKLMTGVLDKTRSVSSVHLVPWIHVWHMENWWMDGGSILKVTTQQIYNTCVLRAFVCIFFTNHRFVWCGNGWLPCSVLYLSFPFWRGTADVCLLKQSGHCIWIKMLCCFPASSTVTQTSAMLIRNKACKWLYSISNGDCTETAYMCKVSERCTGFSAGLCFPHSYG